MSTPQTHTENHLEEFVNRLMEEKEFHLLEEDVQNEIRADLVARLQDKINMAIVTNLPEDKLEGFNTLTKKNDLAKLQEYCEHAIPNLQEVVAQALLEFRQTYLGL